MHLYLYLGLIIVNAILLGLTMVLLPWFHHASTSTLVSECQVGCYTSR